MENLHNKKLNSSRKPLVRITTIDEAYMLNNYGTFLQHYALRRFLKNNGYDVYRDVWESKAYKGKFESLKWWYEHLFSKNALKMLLKILLTTLGIYKKISKNAARQYFFRPLTFRKSYVSLIGPWREYPGYTPDYCIAGSDQVFFWWDHDSHQRRFMDNAPEGAEKISYAASSNWYIARESDEWKSYAASSLKTYKAISVREKIGQQIFQALLPEKDVFHVADPTLLLDKAEYLKVASHRPYLKKKTLLCYMLHCDEKKLHLNELQEIAKTLGAELKIIGIQETENHVPVKFSISPGPEDFLRAYRDADYVITNSFHGTVFSVIFEKKWVSVYQNGVNATSQNVRHSELLETLGLSHRTIEFNKDKILEILSENIDWENVNKKKNIFRNSSAEWLLNALDHKK